MRMETLEAVFRALAESGVRYIVAGGVAVNAHGYQRLTQDLDLVVALDPDNVRTALEALASLGYGPVLPVPALGFADPGLRRQWIEERNLEVFSLTSASHPGTTVDLFARVPFDFDEERRAAMEAEVAEGLAVPFVRLSTLIEMKERLARPRDQDDVAHLKVIQEERAEEGS